jgi:hypothetical protein
VLHLRTARTVFIFVLLGPPLGFLLSYALGAWIRFRVGDSGFRHPLQAAAATYDGIVSILGTYLFGAPCALVAAVIFLALLRLTRPSESPLGTSYGVLGLMGAAAGFLATAAITSAIAFLAARRIPANLSPFVAFAMFGGAAGVVCAITSRALALRSNVA